jgi:CheY-like chemotaxis protein
VLLIDDEPSILSTMGRALERLGAEVTAAKRGSEGIELLRARPDIGLIFLDLAMPELDGTEVLRQIRELDARVPVYIMTGFLPRGLDVSGATGVLTKPIDISKLGELVRSAVGP